VIGDAVGVGDAAFNEYAPNAVFVKNVLAGGFPSLYTGRPENFLNPPASLAGVGFVNLAAGDYHLAPSSPFKNLGTDGKTWVPTSTPSTRRPRQSFTRNGRCPDWWRRS
jgi:hypothetical protein